MMRLVVFICLLAIFSTGFVRGILLCRETNNGLCVAEKECLIRRGALCPKSQVCCVKKTDSNTNEVEFMEP